MEFIHPVESQLLIIIDDIPVNKLSQIMIDAQTSQVVYLQLVHLVIKFDHFMSVDVFQINNLLPFSPKLINFFRVYY